MPLIGVCSKCRRCVVIYEKHKNVLQYKESECDDMYMDQSNHPVSNPLPIRTMQKSSELNGHSSNGRGGAHPNTSGGHSRSSADQYQFRSNDDNDNCKHQLFDIYISLSLYYDSLVHIYVNVNYATTCCYYHPFHSVVLRLCLAQCNNWCADCHHCYIVLETRIWHENGFFPIYRTSFVGFWYIKVTFFFLYNFYKQTINLYRL